MNPNSPDASPHANAQGVMGSLVGSMALLMTSYVIVLPLFARRFTELGAGVSALGTSSMAYAVAATVCAPVMGALADRTGRRPIVLASLAAHALAFAGLLFAASPVAIIVLRGLLGALAAGLLPAAIGMVADLAPDDRRAQWIGILTGGESVGWIAGPVLGGLFYDRWGFSIALIASTVMTVVACLVALLGIRETRRAQEPGAAMTPSRVPTPGTPLRSLSGGQQSSLSSLAAILGTCFVVMFAWAFVEPRFMYHVYDDLGWSSLMLGSAMSVYGVALMVGEFGLGRLSDVLGRKPVILVGLLLFSAQFLGMALCRHFASLAVAFAIAGLGNALYDPALSASVLDVTSPEHQARMLGLKSTMGSIGSILGPALLVLATPSFPAKSGFLLAAGSVFLIMLIVFIGARGLRRGSAASPRSLPTKQTDGEQLAVRTE